MRLVLLGNAGAGKSSLARRLQARQPAERLSLDAVAFVQFNARNGMAIPNRPTPSPGYDVAHDMNHVISGYEPTGPGEVALGAFKLAMRNSEANWMASLTNFLIHEVGLFKLGSDEQFVPYGGGGEPYHGVGGRCGAGFTCWPCASRWSTSPTSGPIPRSSEAALASG